MRQAAPVAVGVLGSRRRLHVDGAGRVSHVGARWALDWCVGADDRWRVPSAEVAVRQSLIGAAPVVQTVMRVPSGDAIQRVYGVGGTSDAVVIEVENDSPAPVAIGLVLTAPDLLARLVTSRPPGRWAVAAPGGTLDLVRAGQASEGPLPEPDRGCEVAVVWPVAHRTTFRAALALGEPQPDLDVRSLPGGFEVARGWKAQLARAMRADLPDTRLRDAIDAALACAVLGADDVAVLEDWGFDDEATAAWHGGSWRDRRRARKRRAEPVSWSRVRALLDAASPVWTWRHGPGAFLLAVRSLLVHESASGELALVADLPPGWVGQAVDVHDAPTRAGRLSYAVRWHGERPALLWECEQPGVCLRAPGLDPTWSTREQRGEALLAPRAARARGAPR